MPSYLKIKNALSMSFVVFLLLITTSFSYANSDEHSEKVKVVVEESVQELLVKFNQEKSYYDTDPDRFFSNMDEALSKIVDFRRIAARVMGKYGRSATDKQKDKFVKVFKSILVLSKNNDVVVYQV